MYWGSFLPLSRYLVPSHKSQHCSLKNVFENTPAIMTQPPGGPRSPGSIQFFPSNALELFLPTVSFFSNGRDFNKQERLVQMYTPVL